MRFFLRIVLFAFIVPIAAWAHGIPGANIKVVQTDTGVGSQSAQQILPNVWNLDMSLSRNFRYISSQVQSSAPAIHVPCVYY